MSKDKIKLLEEKIEDLRKENSQLRTALNVRELQGENGQPVLSREKLDSTVKALVRQLDELKEFHASIGKALERSEKVKNSMEALVPALELQIRGYEGEIEKLHAAAEDTAETYAGIVANLENQLKEIKQEKEKEQEELKVGFEAELSELKARISQLEATISEQETDKKEVKINHDEGAEPFTSLSIFVEP
jgi:chromosome segregation ATPase